MELLLARHGNTFAPGEKVVWVGRDQDLPLVPSGQAQARAVAGALQARSGVIASVYCGPLKRACEYANIIHQELGTTPPIIDSRLDELDYGAWGGKSEEEIRAQGHGLELDRWSKEGIWPVTSQWSQSEAEVFGEVQAFVRELLVQHDVSDTILIVSSNGRLRYFLASLATEFQRRQRSGELKMRTGALSAMSFLSETEVRLHFWNRLPSEL